MKFKIIILQAVADDYKLTCSRVADIAVPQRGYNKLIVNEK